MAATSTPTSNLTLTGADMLRWFERTPRVQYGFCSGCGSTLFWRASGGEAVLNQPDESLTATDAISITAGSLDQPTGLTTTTAIYCDEAGDYHNLDLSLESFGGERQKR